MDEALKIVKEEGQDPKLKLDLEKNLSPDLVVYLESMSSNFFKGMQYWCIM